MLGALATTAATPSDLHVWFADPPWAVGAPPEEDTCYASTAFGQEYDAQAGCGAAAAVNGVALPADSYSDVTFIGNARNAIFITTNNRGAAEAISTHSRFLSTYGLTEGDVPLVRLDLAEWHDPVSLYGGGG